MTRGTNEETEPSLECFKRAFILDFGERIQHAAPLWLANLSMAQPHLEWKGIKTKEYLQAISIQFKWNFSKLRKFEVYSVHMLSRVFIPSSLNKQNLETSSHFLVTQDQNPSSSNHKS